MLIEHNLFGTVNKVADAINLLRQHEPPEGYYLCFSGGKDSVVIHDLALKAGVKFDAHFNITTVEPPQLRRFIRDHYPNVIYEHPTLSMFQLIIKKKMLPLRQARYCCSEFKERCGRGRVKITGIRSEESPRRAKRPQIDQDNHSTGSFIHVIKDWSAKDVWQYIHENNLPYCELYDLGFSRIGCVLCPFSTSKNIQADLELFPAIVAMYKRACIKLFEIYSSKNKFPFPNCRSGQDLFNWWIERHKKISIADDCNSIPLFSEDDGSIL
ncbi:MAG: phosphoadenosine phosphosulfate reductase family protein [Selenomonadaceae bacterium]|nr:phosphoadenosine phosphosulfate reductase family protein [Selenomonadaceae bacterium]